MAEELKSTMEVASTGDSSEGNREVVEETREQDSPEGKKAEGPDTSNEEPLDSKESKPPESDENPEGEPKKKRKSGFRRKMDRLNERVRLREQETEYWKSKYLNSQGKEDLDTEGQSSSKSLRDQKPDPDKYESHDEYLEALVDWNAEQSYKPTNSSREKKSCGKKRMLE